MVRVPALVAAAGIDELDARNSKRVAGRRVVDSGDWSSLLRRKFRERVGCRPAPSRHVDRNARSDAEATDADSRTGVHAHAHVLSEVACPLQLPVLRLRVSY